MTRSIDAPDLSREVPRSPFEELGGIPWLPRLIDKARATYAGTVGDYVPYPCPTDRLFLACTGLDANELGARIRAGDTDEDLAEFAVSAIKRGPRGVELFRRLVLTVPRNPIPRWVIRLMTPNIRRSVIAAHPEVDRALLDCVGALLALDEGHKLP